MAVTDDAASLDPGPDGEGDTTPAADPAFDATPRVRPPRRRRTVIVTVALVAIVAVLAVIAIRSLGDASLFFLNADEAVEQRDDLGDDRFRIQGTPKSGTITETTVEFEQAVAFGRFDHCQGNTVLNAAGRVACLDLTQQLCLQVRGKAR